MPFLSWCSIMSRRRGSFVCAAPIHLGRQLGLLPGFPLSGGNESPRQLRQRAPLFLIRSFELIKLLLSRARGPVSPIPVFHVTTTTIRTTGVNMRNTGAVPRNLGATSVAPRGRELTVTTGLVPSCGGATTT